MNWYRIVFFAAIGGILGHAICDWAISPAHTPMYANILFVGAAGLGSYLNERRKHAKLTKETALD